MHIACWQLNTVKHTLRPCQSNTLARLCQIQYIRRWYILVYRAPGYQSEGRGSTPELCGNCLLVRSDQTFTKMLVLGDRPPLCKHSTKLLKLIAVQRNRKTHIRFIQSFRKNRLLKKRHIVDFKTKTSFPLDFDNEYKYTWQRTEREMPTIKEVLQYCFPICSKKK